MNRVGNIDVDGKATLGKTLHAGNLGVPSNQRDYSWKDTHVRDLFNDIQEVLDGEGGEYFLGTIVIMEYPEDPSRRRTIVDGQQRLATSTIFLAAVRDYFIREGDTQTADEIDRDHLQSLDLDTRESTAKLHLNDGDNRFFYIGYSIGPAMNCGSVPKRACDANLTN